MLKKFTRPFTVVDTSAMLRFVGQMEQILNDLSRGLIPNDYDYSSDELVEYARSLVDGQFKIETITRPGNWSILPRRERHVPGEAVIDFIFKPTYIAIATLSLIKLYLPELSAQVNGVEKTLKLGMEFISDEGFPGHGYDAEFNYLEAFGILARGHVQKLLQDEPQLCPTLKELLEGMFKGYKDSLMSGNTIGGWDHDFSLEFKEAIGLYENTSSPNFEKPKGTNCQGKV